ncbi:MAG: WD40 repeat protein, partial [Myxococcota bacterium]
MDRAREESMGEAEVSWPADLEAATLPTFLALPMQEYLREPNARVRLHWMIDTVEVAIRWACALLCAEATADDGALPTMIRRSLQEHIERPTVGRWVGMLRILSTAAPKSPLCPPRAFALHDEIIAPLFSSDGDENSSMLVLRNRIAHGGGLSTRLAGELLAAHAGRFHALIRAIADCTEGLDIQAMGDDDVIVSLMGLSPAPATTPRRLDGAGEQVWLTNGQRALSLSPLVAFGPIRALSKDGQFVEHGTGRAPQIYARASPQSLSYTPLGRDEAHAERSEVEAFRALFGLDEARTSRRAGRRDFSHRDFLREAADQAESLVGRVAEIKTVKQWLKACPTRDTAAPRIAWLRAGPGLGKSMLMARVARDLGNSSHHGLYFHHFQTGDVRNNRRMFLQLLQEALWAWEPLKARTAPPSRGGDIEDLLEDVTARLGALAGLPSKNPRAPAPSFRVLIDGLDAAVGQDPGLPELIRQLALSGSIWLLAGRPEHGLSGALRGDDVSALFGSGGLPPMGPDDLRALLLEGLGNARYALLKRDEDAGEDGQTVRNAFIEGVVERAGGLPLYVELLLEDLRSGHLTVDDEEQLPDGLSTYYAELMSRMGISDVQVNLTLLVCLLARAEEALDPLSIRYLLSPSLDIDDERLEPEEAAHISAVLRAGRALLRESVAASGDRAFSLYHQGFREYINDTDALRRTRRRAEALLVQLADRWSELPESNVRDHLFRWGTEYALWWGGRRGLVAARGRLMDFDYLMARTQALQAFENLDLAREYTDARAQLPGDHDFTGWADFFGSREHLLRRGTERWSADRILLQLAMEYADSSPVTQAAEDWLARCSEPWLWIRHTRRPAHVSLSACQSVLEGHSRKVDGVLLLSPSEALSWSLDNTLRLWDLDAGTSTATLDGHEKRIRGALPLPGRRAVSYADDGTIVTWNLDSGERLHTLDADNKKPIEALTLLDSGQAISCSRDRDKTVKLWDLDTGTLLNTYKGHKRYIRRLQPLPGGRFLSIDRSIRLWDPATGDKPAATLTGHKLDVFGVIPFGGDRLLSWSKDKTLRIWDLAASTCLHTLEGHAGDVTGAMIINDEQIISWGKAGGLKAWSIDGEETATLLDAGPAIDGAALLGERLLSWDSDGILRLWDLLTLTPLHTLHGHDGSVVDVVQLTDGRLLSLSSRGAIEVWDLDTGRHLVRLRDHITAVWGAAELPGGRLLSWSGDRTLRTWSTDPTLLA